jgi:hypothetical protein
MAEGKLRPFGSGSSGLGEALPARGLYWEERDVSAIARLGTGGFEG